MKKSVTAMLVLAVLALAILFFNSANLTGLQVLDLPAPPSPPGAFEDQQQQAQQQQQDDDNNDRFERDLDEYVEDLSEIIARVSQLEQKSRAIDTLPTLESRIVTLESRSDVTTATDSRYEGLEGRVRTLEVDVQNLKNRPEVQAAFFDQLNQLEGTAKRNAILSISLSIFLLLIVGGLVGMTIIGKQKEHEENKQLIRQYLHTYTQQGYTIDTLKMHLRACGWKDDIINDTVQELRR